MPENLIVSADSVPDGMCIPGQSQELVNWIAQYIQVEVSDAFSLFNYNAYEPGVDERDRPWLKLDVNSSPAGAPLGWYIYYDSAWRKVTEIPEVDVPKEVPIGATMSYFGTTDVGDGDGVTEAKEWLLCDGRAADRTLYADLYAVIADSCGQGDGSTTFHLPDARGRFQRFVDDTAGVDPDAASRVAMNTGGNAGDAVGSVQGDELESHTHSYNAHGNSGASGMQAGGNNQFATGNKTTGASGGSETRPKNFYSNLIIRAT